MGKRRGRVTLGGFLVGAATTVVLLTVSMPAIVSADGGQTNLIHACLLPDAGTGANVVIIGADETCPPGTSTTHWAAGDPPALESPELTSVVVEVPPTRKVNKKLYAPFGIKMKQTKTVTKTLGPSKDFVKELTASCPNTHPFLLSGGAEAVEPDLGEEPIISEAVGWHAWRSVHKAWTWFCLSADWCAPWNDPPTWTLQVTIECVKMNLVKPTQGTVKPGG